MADFTQALFRIDPTQGLVDYVNAVKPYHTKILDVLVEYVYTEKVNTSVGERWSWKMDFTRPDSDVEYSCGYGYRWDPSGLTSPEATPTSRIINATGKLLIDVATVSGSSVMNIIRNVSGHQLAVDAPIVFQNIPVELYNPATLVEYITPGKTYYVTTITPTTVEVSDTVGGTPISFGAAATLQILPQGLSYNTFLVEPTISLASYEVLATNISANQISFVNGHTLTGVDVMLKQWRFSVGTWTQGSGYTTGSHVVTLLGGVGAGADATALVVVDSTGKVIEVAITNPGTKTYHTGDVLVAGGGIGPGVGFTFTVVTPTLTLPMTLGDAIFINGNTSTTANGKYTISNIQGSIVTVTEAIPPLTDASGSLYTVDTFDAIPYWPSGLKVRVRAVGTLPGPLVNAGTYYFIPSSTIGVFNLAHTRYPHQFDDYVDITSWGGKFTVERAEPFTPGDIVTVYGTQNNHNNGNYVVSFVSPEGNNFRVGVMQNIPRTTPNPSPLPYDGAMALHLGSYDMPLVCPATRTPDLYANTFIDENLQFTFEITARDFIGASVIENDVVGWGNAMFGTMVTAFGTGTDSVYPYTTMTSGVSTSSSTHLVLPTGFDTQMFDLGAIDETLAFTRVLQNLP